MPAICNRHVFIALLASTGPILILSHGFFDAGSIFSAIFLIAIPAVLLVLSPWKKFDSSPSDILFGLLLAAVAISFLTNGVTASPKELTLLALSLAAYPACRLAPEGNRSIFIWITAAIVVLGSIVTTAALVSQWNNPHGKPYVFGQFDAAAIEFLTSLGFVIIAATCARLTARRTWIISALISIPSAIFAASQVRFTFVAIAGALVFAALITEPEQRKYVLFVLLALTISCVAGMAARPTATASFIKHELDFISEAGAASLQPETAPATVAEPLRCHEIDRNNSIEIRGQLLRDAIGDLPRAGLSGLGLDGFLVKSCMGHGTQIHNSFLQAFVEFGWIGGAALLLLVASAFFFLMPIARYDDEARFVLCSLIFMALEAMAHGRLSRDSSLFLFVGYAVGMQSKVLKRLPIREGSPSSYHLVLSQNSPEIASRD